MAKISTTVKQSAKSPKKKFKKKSVAPAERNDSILIIGAGNMGGSLAKGLMRSPLRQMMQIRIYDTSIDRLEKLTNESPVQVVSNLEQDDLADTIIAICVKPQDLLSVAKSIKGRIGKDALVISILAGTPIEEVMGALDFEGACVRAMPNIPAMVGAGATAMAHNEHCDERQKEWALRVFQAVGEAWWTKESLMDAVTGLSGSGPAYIYMVIEALTDGGVKMGLPRQLSANLATQTVLGSGLLVKSTGTHPAILKDQVTTPGGTTISAVHELEAHGLRAMLISAVATATERSTALGKGKK